MITLALSIVVIVALYLYGIRNFDYWEKRGVKHDKPVLFFGNNTRNYLMRLSVTQIAIEMYWKYPTEKLVGYFRGSRPELVVRDPELVKRILITDFPYFYGRGLNPHKEVEPLLRNLFFVDGDLWRLLRQRMTPAFTSGKLKAMFPLIVERAEKLQARILSAAASTRKLDARDLMARYTTDFIGACGFGLNADSLQDEESTFRKLGASLFKKSPKDVFVAILKEMFPNTFRHLRTLSRLDKDMTALIDEVLRQRNYESSGRNDFIDLMLECKKKGKISVDSIEKIKNDGSPEIVTLEMTNELIVAQVFLFFVAGFETSSSAMSITLHELAYNPEVQVKVQEEIDRVLANHNNELSYEAIKEMTYLEWTFREGMRIFPSVGYLIRQCEKKYTFKDLDLTIDEGVKIILPIQAMQNDPKYFDNPSEFRPERFEPEKIDVINKFVNLPFGDGPRACVGERMGLMQSMAGLAAVLSRFTVRPAPGAPRHPIVEPRSSIIQTVRHGIPLMFYVRQPKP